MRRYLLLIAPVLFAPSVVLATTKEKLCQGANVGAGQACPGGDPAAGDTALTTEIGDIVNLMLYLAGAIAVIVIIYGGIRYVTSTGDAARVKAAKDTIMYAVVGLIVALLAYAIVNFVVNNIKP
jgi:hypothetical protein